MSVLRTTPACCGGPSRRPGEYVPVTCEPSTWVLINLFGGYTLWWYIHWPRQFARPALTVVTQLGMLLKSVPVYCMYTSDSDRNKFNNPTIELYIYAGSSLSRHPDLVFLHGSGYSHVVFIMPRVSLMY